MAAIAVVIGPDATAVALRGRTLLTPDLWPLASCDRRGCVNCRMAAIAVVTAWVAVFGAHAATAVAVALRTAPS
jgi:hypothetical protein